MWTVNYEAICAVFYVCRRWYLVFCQDAKSGAPRYALPFAGAGRQFGIYVSVLRAHTPMRRQFATFSPRRVLIE